MYKQAASAALLRPAQVAALFGVGPWTVVRWADAGLLRTVRTLGGHRRFLQSEVQALLETEEGPDGVLGGATNTAPIGAPDDL